MPEGAAGVTAAPMADPQTRAAGSRGPAGTRGGGLARRRWREFEAAAIGEVMLAGFVLV